MARRKAQDTETQEPTHEATTEAAVATREPGDEPERKPLPNPWAIKSNPPEGLEYRLARDPYQAEIKFADGKPSDEVRKIMKDGGFRWAPDYEVWARPIEFRTQMQDRLQAERVYAEVLKAIRAEKGIVDQDLRAF